MRDILAEQNVPFVDVFSLDVEGAEYDILNSVDFTKFQFGAAAIETNGQTELFKKLLEPLGYTYQETWNRSDWYTHKDFEAIYGRKWKKSSPEDVGHKVNLVQSEQSEFRGPVYTPGIIYPAPVH